MDEKYCESAISPASPVDPIDNLIQIQVDEKESIFAQTKVANKGIPQIRSTTTAEVQTIPVIDQVCAYVQVCHFYGITILNIVY